MSEYNFERLTVKEPAPVVDSDPHGKRWIGLLILLTALIAALCLSQSQSREYPAATWPADGPSSVFGQTLAPEPIPCLDCTCPDGSWLARFVGALDDQSANPREIRDVLHRAYTESRFEAGVVSPTGDYGICQINASAHPEVDVARLATDPVYAAVECLRVYRSMYAACGADWQCCYRYGVRGCRRVTGL